MQWNIDTVAESEDIYVDESNEDTGRADKENEQQFFIQNELGKILEDEPVATGHFQNATH